MLLAKEQRQRNLAMIGYYNNMLVNLLCEIVHRSNLVVYAHCQYSSLA